MEEAPGEPDGVDDRRGDPTAREALDRTVDEADVEARVVSGQRSVAREGEEPADRELGPGSAPQLRVVEARHAGDRRRQRDAGLDERVERLGDLEPTDPRGADLADPVAAGREARRLEVEDDDLGILDERVDAALVRQADAHASPREARITVDDVRQK